MGMFDEVKWESSCPVCGHEVTGWQTKDDVCQLRTFTPKELIDRQEWHDMGEPFRPRKKVSFYADCSTCGSWLEMQIEQVQPKGKP